jgi:hypothetical protein
LGNFRCPESKHGGWFNPLVSADRGNSEQVNFGRAQQHQQGNEVGSLRAGAVLVGDDFDLGGLGGSENGYKDCGEQDCCAAQMHASYLAPRRKTLRSG